MSSRISAIRASVLLLLFAWTAAPGVAANRAKSAPEVEIEYHSMVPLGMEMFAVHSWRNTLTVMALAENPEFEGWRREVGVPRPTLLSAEGQPVERYPAQISFRVTASTRDKPPEQVAFPIAVSLPENDYLLKLRFRLKIFHGLQATILEPARLEMIGVPADVASDERIYRMLFELPRVPVEDRIVLEVLSPDGKRLCKFHLDLN